MIRFIKKKKKIKEKGKDQHFIDDEYVVPTNYLKEKKNILIFYNSEHAPRHTGRRFLYAWRCKNITGNNDTSLQSKTHSERNAMNW